MSAKPVPVPPATWKVALALGLVYIIWGSTYLGIRFAIDSIPPYLMVACRFSLAGILMFILARATGAPLPRRLEWRSGMIIGGLLLLGGNGGVTWSEQKLPTGLAALIVATVPVWMALIEWLRPGGNRPGRRAIVGLVIGFIGMLILVGPEKILVGKGIDPLSAGVILLGTIMWASGSIYSRTDHAALPDSPLMATAVQMLGGAALLLIFAALIGDFGRFKPEAVTLTSVIALSYLVIFGSLVAYTCYIWLLRVSTPARASTYAYVNPVVALILGWLVRGEQLTVEMLIATPLIVLAVILITTSRTHRPQEAAKPSAVELPVSQPARLGVEE